MSIRCLMNLPNTVMDLANGTYKGRSVPEIIVIIVTVSSAALGTINHYHHNTFHRNYCLVVTLVGIAGCIKIHSYYILGTQNQRMDRSLDRLSNTIDELSDTKEVLTTQVTKFETENKALTSEVTKFETENKALTSEVTKFATENKTLTSEVTKFETENKALTSEVDELKTVKDGLQKNVDDLSTVKGAMKTLQTKLGTAADYSTQSAETSKASAETSKASAETSKASAEAVSTLIKQLAGLIETCQEKIQAYHISNASKISISNNLIFIATSLNQGKDERIRKAIGEIQAELDSLSKKAVDEPSNQHPNMLGSSFFTIEQEKKTKNFANGIAQPGTPTNPYTAA